MDREGCIPVGELEAFATCELSAARLRDIEEHLAGCASCRGALDALVPTELPGVPPPRAVVERAGPESRLRPGTALGRFVVGRELGAGGMGVVYAAHDTELEREVAIKVLRRRTDADSMRMLEARMRREAQAMARLSHPNVLPVFDVGVYDGHLTVAMERVDGGTLRQWLAESKRTVAEIVGVFAKAGSGLEAAHAAGLVHRDFKPDNVLVGKDGRVRVTDFGLARFTGAPTESDPGSPPAPLVLDSLAAETLTRTGTALGTPAYMAPEQLQGKPADARTDQFTFCVALYEALAGVRPFPVGYGVRDDDGASPNRLARIPRWLRGPLLRGLARAQGDRFPDMAPLLASLRRRPPTRRRILVAGALIVVAGLVGASALRGRGARALECRAAGDRVQGVWSDADRTAVERAFVATGRPYAGDTLRRTAEALDTYAAQWSSLAVAVCEARQDAARREASLKRAECLDLRLGAVRAFVGVLRRADVETLDRAVQGARALPAIDTSTRDDPMEGEGVPSDPTVRAAARAVDQGLREAEALHTAGHDAESLVVATQALADAERVGFAPLRARALLTRARAEEGKGDFATAERTYRDASIAAEAAGAWATAARALCGAAWRAADRGDYDRAEEQFDHAAVWVQRFGDDDELRGELELARGRELGERGKYAEARALGEKALERFERKGSDHAIEAVAELGIVADYEGRKSDARALYGRVLAWDERVLGAGSSKAARVLENLGMLEQDEGDFDAALRDESRAVAILNATLGPDHPATGVALSNLANVEDWLERPAEALPLAQRALAIAEKATGASADTGYALLALGGALRGLGRDEEVIGPSERALAIFQREQRPLAVADAQANLGLALHATRRDEPRARALLLRARETLVAEGRRERLAEIDKALGTTKR